MHSTPIRHLRRSINQIINDLPPAVHIQKMEELRQLSSHSCRPLASQPINEDSNYNCHAYSLGIHENRAVLFFKRDIFRGSMEQGWFNFSSVAEKCLTPISSSDVQSGDVVFYLKQQTSNVKRMNVIHSGRVKENNLIISKWGINSHIWEHPLEEVPAIYEDTNGDISAAYFQIRPSDLKHYLIHWENQLRSYSHW